MNEIIITGGRSHGKSLDEVLKSEEYLKSIERLRTVAGISAEDLHDFSKRMALAFTQTTDATQRLKEASELIRLAGQKLNKEIKKVNYYNSNHVNPYFRQFKRFK